jgi:hypothetical protein
MPTQIVGATGIDKVQDGIIVNADIDTVAASKLTGTIADARFPATLPAKSAANLTNIPAANITGTLPAISATNLTSIPAANITGTLPAISGANLTGIEGVPSGVIAMWHGASNAIPSGWVICDGNNSTPNLTDKFIKSTGTANATGGSTTSGAHTLTTAEMPSHTHPYEGGNNAQSNAHMGKGYYGHNYLTTQATGGGGSHTHPQNEPVYFSLIFIMKT